MAYLLLGLFALMAPALTVIFYLLDHKTGFGKLNYWIRQVIYGLAFGGIAILCTEFGVQDNGAVMNVRDSAPIAAGLIFGWPAGVISGFIGGLERFLSAYWRGTFYTQWACSISTFISGLVAAICYAIIYRKNKVNWFQAFFIGLALETSHILMIFITNMDDTITAYKYVSRIGNTMILFVAASAFLSVLLIQLLHLDVKKKQERKTKKWKLANIMHASLFITIAFAYINVALFTRNIQTRISEDNAKHLLNNTVNDTVSDVRDISDSNLLTVANEIAMMIESRQRSGHEVTDDFLKRVINNEDESGIYFAVSEINVVNVDGFISISSSHWAKDHYDMRSGEQSKEFADHILDNHETYYIQPYGPISGDESVYMKYGAYVLEHGGFVQVGYNKDTYYTSLEHIVSQVARNRRVGSNGYVVITNHDYKIYGTSSTLGEVASFADIGFDTASVDIDSISDMVGCSLTINNKKAAYRYNIEQTEGYYVFGFISEEEISLNKDISTYVYTYLEFIIFALVFLVVYVLFDRIILDDINKANKGLEKITAGDLSVKIDAKRSEEFIRLSDSINATVDTLKDFIEKEKERINSELALAKAIQFSSLPSKQGYLNYHEFSIYATMQTAKQVGGDFYDYFPLDNDRFAILIADVSGKGIPAALFMMRTKSLIKSLLETGISVDGAIQRAHVQLCDNNDASMFVTCWCGVINRKTGVVEYVNAGHNPPVIRSHGVYHYLKGKANLVMGGYKNANYDRQTFKLEPGDVIFLYTDGITEATKGNNIFYGEDRLLDYLNSTTTINARSITEGVLKDTLDFVGEHEQSDDMTLLTFTYFGEVEYSRYEYGCEPSDYDQAHKDLNAYINSHHIAHDKKETIVICFEEILTNIIKYSYQENKGKIIILYYISKEQLSIVFIDSGKKFNPLKKEDPDVTLQAKERKIGGLGIYMVKNMVDDIYYSYQEKHNILMINILLNKKGN